MACVVVIAGLAACGSSSGEAALAPDAARAPDATLAPDGAPTEDGPRVAFAAPASGGEHRAGIDIELVVDSPAARLHEAGVEIGGQRKVLCGDVDRAHGLHCGGAIDVWDWNLAAGAHTLRGFAVDEHGRTATAEVAIVVRPYRRPRWDFAPDAGTGAPVLAGDLLLVPADRLYALRADDGAVVWSFDPRRGGAFDHVRGVVADRDRAYLTAGLDGADPLIAVDLATGAALWTIEAEAAVLSAPVLDGAGHVVIAGSDSDLTAFDRDGARVWRADLDNVGDRVPARAPVVAADGTLRQRVQGRPLVVRVATDGTLLDEVVLDGGYHSAIAAGPDGTLYTSGDDGVRAYRPDGSRWFAATAGKVTRPVFVGPSGRVYAAVEHVGPLALDAAGIPLWSPPLPGVADPPFEAPDGALYVPVNGWTYRHDRDFAHQEDLPYCSGTFLAGAGLIFCTSYGRVYAIDP